MITALCVELNNYFIKNDNDIQRGIFTFENNQIIPLPPILEGQFFRVVGSALNDGVYRYDESLQLKDETFDGAIWLMRVPKDVIDLAQEVEQWVSKNADALNSPYQSESFGGYSYSKKTGSSDSGNCAYSWQDHFANRLRKYRRLHV